MRYGWVLFLIFQTVLYSNYSWSPYQTLSDPTLIAQDPSLAVDPQGNSVVTWSLVSGDDLFIQASTKLATETAWSAAVTLTPNIELAISPKVCVDGAGNAIIIWIASDGSGDDLESITKPFGQPWQDTILPLPTLGNVRSFDACMDINGNITVIWQEGLGQIYGTSKSFLDLWPVSPDLLSNPAATSLTPRIDVDGSGVAIAVWQQGEDIYSVSKPAGQNWSLPASPIISNGSFSIPAIAVNPAGDAIVVCRGSSGVTTAFKPRGLAWQAQEDIPNSAINPNISPNVDLDSQGNCMAVWNTSDNALFSSTKLKGETWNPGTQFAPSAFHSAPASINVSPCDLALIAWADESVQVSSGSIGGDFSRPFVLGFAGDQNESTGDPIAIQGVCGEAIAVWLGMDGNPTIQIAQSRNIGALSSLTGAQIKNDFGTLTSYTNELNWAISPDPNITGFQIYRNGRPIAFVGPSTFKYKDVRQKKGQPTRYGVAVVESQGAETSPQTILIP
jgi:hypothetical protein